MKKIFLIFMLMGIMIVSAGILVSAKDEMGMVVNGENANMKISPKVIEGVTMVPFRETMETLQAKITWDADTKSIKAVRKNKSVSIQVGNNVIKVGNQDVEVPSSPVVVDNVTYVPLRVISTGFGCKIRYDAINNNIVITDTALAKMTTTTKMTKATTTTKATTEATTETTTINYNDSIITGVSKALHKMVIQDLRLALNNYSLGSANTATRLANSYINRTTSNWLGMATTPEDKKFVAAAKGAYTKLAQTCRKLDQYQNTYGKYNGARKELIDAKNDIIDAIDACGMATSVDEFTKKTNNITTIQNKAAKAMNDIRKKNA